MWDLNKPNPVKLIVGILAADEGSLQAARESIAEAFGPADMVSEVWPFTQTDYYKDETGESILRMFVAIEKLIDPGELAEIKHTTNRIERDLAEKLGTRLARPVNLDPGIIEPSKLVLASTKNFSHRIYIGRQMFAEVTLIFSKGKWQSFPFTFPDYKEDRYHGFLNKVRTRLVEQLKQSRANPK